MAAGSGNVELTGPCQCRLEMSVESKPLPIGRRENQRARVSLAASLVSVSGTQTVRLNNISQGGACITAQTPMKRGSDVFLRWGAIDAFGTVTWVEGPRCGVMFEEPLTQDDIRDARWQSDHQQTVSRAEGRAAARDFVSGNLRVGFD
jgi:hypothetical protein